VASEQQTATWFILMTEPQREVTAVAGLIGRRIQAYGPTFYKKMIQRGRKIEVQKPLFPGYIFARLREGIDDFGLPKRVAGVRDYLRLDGRPCSLPGAAIDAISSKEAYEAERFFNAGAAPFEIGETVRVSEGPFSGFAAEVYECDDRGRVGALVTMFGRKTKVRFDGEQLEKA